MKIFKNFELIFWIAAVLALAICEPGKQHYTICPFALLDIHWCPGCGLGRSISHLLHGNILQSFHFHYFGLPALLILLSRIYSLLNNTFYLSKLKPKNYESQTNALQP